LSRVRQRGWRFEVALDPTEWVLTKHIDRISEGADE
jgi:hypothetical protein